MEYYFNCKYNIPNESIREKLKNYFKKLMNLNAISMTNNKFILHCLESIKNNTQEFSLDDIFTKKFSDEKNLYEKIFSNQNIIYDMILFLVENIDNQNKNEYFIEYYFYIIKNILNNVIGEYEYINDNIYYVLEKNYYNYFLLLKIINIFV